MMEDLSGVNKWVPGCWSPRMTAALEEDAVRQTGSITKPGWSYDINEGGVKYDQGKPRLGLVPPEAIRGMAEVLTIGANKYTEHNWRKGMSWMRVYDGLLRHLTAWASREELDPETQLSHLKHAMCCMAFLLTYETTRTGTDDRYQVGA